jgi:hypothetical protein
MKHALLTLTLLVGLAALLFVLMPPAPAGAAPPGCACGEVGVSPSYTGTGATCDAAKNSVRAQADPFIDSYCSPDGSCQRILVVTSGCSFVNGQWQVTGYIDFRCWACID